MSEYWKSTPSYWCKFCSQYVRDSAIEKRNHEASIKHQNNIQRSLRNLHKNHDREEREKQRAKDEVARLKGEIPPPRDAAPTVPATTGPLLTPAQQRKAHAEQLASLGVLLSGELKREVTGVGEFEVVNERQLYNGGKPVVSTVSRSLAEILAEERSGGGANENEPDDRLKRKAEDDEDDDENTNPRDEEARPKRRAWGSNFKTYPGQKEDDDVENLDSLLSGVRAAKATVALKKEDSVPTDAIKGEGLQLSEETSPITETKSNVTELKQEPNNAENAQTAVIFKKRKVKK
ncbi:uncharacterized protein K489DRAFT_109691 [Dissoconium aciculare CBS 342.82]|jgi:hypothetical protein|uniref:Matrin-type domain-containing protein n=1 Tax=Dissoconium aciculare CBS 342.82 TaxID=1314786 RepID=A0A6J3MH39_9PEZI|nr:uncharacterized protein K489DRAFT_109691 [Dissoconium aciculare CBS 342.82]KAF1826212.1 hypothetical protein K489DRAFT_109691 [Dissoconium aciculare CBS 342.82]